MSEGDGVCLNLCPACLSSGSNLCPACLCARASFLTFQLKMRAHLPPRHAGHRNNISFRHVFLLAATYVRRVFVRAHLS
ncbi:hypothetical protein XELAEV_18042002mg [Xenopus laevis]|uniref:Uncharacterized protein n=1 Tax=Xenopus laevis TaxID=8355 RepID=A0A974C327_XENLA|nr:hypothetical protein XELAEV_18042002mg [Xenopus laevis]